MLPLSLTLCIPKCMRIIKGRFHPSREIDRPHRMTSPFLGGRHAGRWMIGLAQNRNATAPSLLPALIDWADDGDQTSAVSTDRVWITRRGGRDIWLPIWIRSLLWVRLGNLLGAPRWINYTFSINHRGLRCSPLTCFYLRYAGLQEPRVILVELF